MKNEVKNTQQKNSVKNGYVRVHDFKKISVVEGVLLDIKNVDENEYLIIGGVKNEKIAVKFTTVLKHYINEDNINDLIKIEYLGEETARNGHKFYNFDIYINDMSETVNAFFIKL